MFYCPPQLALLVITSLPVTFFFRQYDLTDTHAFRERIIQHNRDIFASVLPFYIRKQPARLLRQMVGFSLPGIDAPEREEEKKRNQRDAGFRFCCREAISNRRSAESRTAKRKC